MQNEPSKNSIVGGALWPRSLELFLVPSNIPYRETFHADFIQFRRSTPLRAARVSKDAEKCKEFEFVELLLYFQLRIE